MLNWGVIGAGTIARVFCNGMRFSRTGRIAAVASRSRARAEALANLPGETRDCLRALDVATDEEVRWLDLHED